MLRLAGCVIADGAGRLLLIHRNTDKYVHWEVPGGKIDAEESARDAAVRELKEELDILVSIVKPLGEVTFTDRGTEMQYNFFVANIAGGEPRIVEEHLHDAVEYIDITRPSELVFSKAAECLIRELNAGSFVIA